MKKTLAAAACTALIMTAGTASASLYDYELVDTIWFDKDGKASESETINGVNTFDPATGTNTVEDGYRGSANYINTSLFGCGKDSLTWTHNFDFIPEFDEIVTASLTLNLEDDGRDCWFKWEFALVYTEDDPWWRPTDFMEVDTGEYSYDLDFHNLEDGSYQVSMIGLAGDFFIHSAELAVGYNGPTAAPIPEPATMVLFGVGLGATGLTAIRRKKSK